MQTHTSKLGRVSVTCIGCGEAFTTKRCRVEAGNGKYCTRSCMHRARAKPRPIPKAPVERTKRECQYCGHGFTVSVSNNARFCSVPCKQKGSVVPRITLTCQGCGDPFQCYPDRPKAFCSKACWETTWTPRPDDDRRRNAARAWRSRVLRRDKHTCQHCGATDRPLNAHHIKPWATHPELRTVLANGLTMCDVCHFALHYPDLANPYAA